MWAKRNYAACETQFHVCSATNSKSFFSTFLLFKNHPLSSQFVHIMLSLLHPKYNCKNFTFSSSYCKTFVKMNCFAAFVINLNST